MNIDLRNHPSAAHLQRRRHDRETHAADALKAHFGVDCLAYPEVQARLILDLHGCTLSGLTYPDDAEAGDLPEGVLACEVSQCEPCQPRLGAGPVVLIRRDEDWPGTAINPFYGRPVGEQDALAEDREADRLLDVAERCLPFGHERRDRIALATAARIRAAQIRGAVLANECSRGPARPARGTRPGRTTMNYLHPHLHRDFVGPDGTRYRADSPLDLDAAIEQAGGHGTVRVVLIHRRPDGSDGAQEVVHEYAV